MPTDPLELERLRSRLADLHRLYHHARGRAAAPPHIGPESWRGPAYRAYDGAAQHIASELHELLPELADAVAIARAELLHAIP